MERNTITTIDKLLIGDRFYKKTDRTKTVYTKVSVKPMANKYRVLTYGALKDGERHPNHMSTDTLLVFLRNTTAVTSE